VAEPYISEEVLPKALKLLKVECDYGLYEDYYEGRHRLAFASEKFRNAFGRLFRCFRANLCPPVVDAVADRLAITGFEVDVEDTEPQEGARPADVRRRRRELREAAQAQVHEQHIRQVWKANRMDYNAGRVHLQALRDGDAYVIVWPDPDDAKRPLIYAQDCKRVRVSYDPERPGQIRWAVKAWRDEDSIHPKDMACGVRASARYRLTLYYADRIEKYITKTRHQQFPDRMSAFEPLEVPGEAWPLPNPYERVPVFHFANNASTGESGASELRDVIPLQDALNKGIMDLMAAMEFVALPQRWATGIEVTYDENGKPISPFTAGVDKLWMVGSTDVKFGDFTQADLSQFSGVINDFRMDIARISGVPLHYFALLTDPPSGEALKALEARLVKKSLDRQRAFGSVWADLVRFCHRIQGHPEEIQFRAVWEDPAPHSEREHAETLLLKKQLGVPRRQLLREAGYSEEQIEEFDVERQEEGADVASGLLGQLDRGEMTGRGVPGDGGTNGAG
jgi:SPP1 Gp6-like portal protein